MICFTLQAYNGLGRHRQTISPDDYLDFRKYNWAYSVSCAVVAFSLLKISIALSLLPLSRARWYAYTLWGLISEFWSLRPGALRLGDADCGPPQPSSCPTPSSPWGPSSSTAGR
jgi:hypothetical protein